MRFFKMKQDLTLPNCISFVDCDITRDRHIFNKEEYETLHDTTVIHLAGTGKESRPDFLEHPVTMISDKLKRIFEAYEDGLLFKEVVMLHVENQLEFLYHHMLLDVLDVKSEKTTYDWDHTEKHLVLDSAKIGAHHIFLVQNSRIPVPLISLAAAESLLRRNVSGILLEEVEVD